MTWGVDYASVDGNRPPDFRALRGAGATFCWVRGSYAAWDQSHGAWALRADPCLERDWKSMEDAALIRGAYMGPAVMASHSPEEQVGVMHAAVQAAGGLRPGVDFPPCLDLEFPQGIAGTHMNRDAIMEWVRRAVAAMQSAFGCWPIIYTSGRVWNDDDSDCLASPPAPDLTACPLWLARYAYPTRQPAVIPPPDGPAPPVPHPWGDEWHGHQDQGDALGAPGFTATVDVDRWRVARQGDSGGHVAWWQRKVGLPADGEFGTETHDEVVAFQRDHGLTVDGVIGAASFCAAAWT